MAVKKPILCLDFDGVCSTYESGWQGADVCNDPPVPGLFEFLEEAREHFIIKIYSSRSTHPKGIPAMKAWFGRWYLRYRIEKHPQSKYVIIDDLVKFATEKPPAHITIDDRALTFQGTWPSVEELKNFKPWFKK